MRKAEIHDRRVEHAHELGGEDDQQEQRGLPEVAPERTRVSPRIVAPAENAAGEDG